MPIHLVPKEALQISSLGLIGGGNMAEALIKGLLAAGVVKPHQVIASDVRADRLKELTARFGVRTTTENIAVAKESDVIILAIKPQIMSAVLQEIAGHVRPSTLV